MPEKLSTWPADVSRDDNFLDTAAMYKQRESQTQGIRVGIIQLAAQGAREIEHWRRPQVRVSAVEIRRGIGRRQSLAVL